MPVILHLGLGSFHRAHQAMYLQRLIDAGERSWTLVGGNLRPDMAETIAALRAQGGAYTLETVAPDGERRYETITALQEIVPYEPGWAGLVAIGADPDTRIVSLTVTEAGYEPGGEIYAALASILRERRRRNAGPLTLLNCDNLRHNGERVRAGLLQFIEATDGPGLSEWVRAHTSCPNAMVDRITPRPTAEVRERVKQATGRDDAAVLMAERFAQWVIEDDFCNGRPAWERVGVQMVESVAPYEEAKIRILNGTHSCIAWAGTLAGTRYIHEGLRDERIRRLAYEYVSNDVIPCLRPSPIDLEHYRDVVLERFGNAALCDTNQRVAMDAFSKIPSFILPTIRDRLARNEPVASVAMLPALFLAFLRRWHHGLLPAAYEDQAMDPAAAHAICASADPVAAFCRNTTLWAELAGDERLTAALRTASARVHQLFPEGVFSMSERLKHRHALLTGAGGGIGLAVARAYLAEGARCTVVDLATEPSPAVQALQAAHPDHLHYLSANVADVEQVEAMVAAAAERFGPVEVLFNNAAVFDLAPLLQSDEAMYERLFAVNVKGMFFVMQKVLAQMVEAGRGVVINLASQAGRRGEALVSHYCATKAAVISYTQSAALAMAPHGIRVNAISPGVIDTPMWSQVDALFARYEGLQPGEKKVAVGKAVPLGHMGRPEDIAGAAIFLASDEASYITAQTLNVDGGNVMS